MQDADPGDTIATGIATADVIPPEMRQAVTLRVVGETLTDGTLGEVVVLEERLDADAAATSQLLLLFTPAAAGGGLLGGVEGTSGYLPVLLVNGEPYVGSELPGASRMGEGSAISAASEAEVPASSWAFASRSSATRPGATGAGPSARCSIGCRRRPDGRER
jgi:hypothetical protein